MPAVVVHQGETSAQWTLKGILETLLAEPRSQLADSLCDKAVFHIVPCINPDGVVAGTYRRSKEGTDLNRIYCEAKLDRKAHPTIAALKLYIAALNAAAKESGGGAGVQLFCDFHGHSSDRGMMIYGFDKDEFGPRDTAGAAGFIGLCHRSVKAFNLGASCMAGATHYAAVGVGPATIACELDVPHAYTVESSLVGPKGAGQHFTEQGYVDMGSELVKAMSDYVELVSTGQNKALAAIGNATGLLA